MLRDFSAGFWEIDTDRQRFRTSRYASSPFTPQIFWRKLARLTNHLQQPRLPRHGRTEAAVRLGRSRTTES
jgi:hypothetical protein